MARPYERLPMGAKKHLEAAAANGLLSECAAATALGMPYSEFRRVIREHQPSRKIWEDALSIECDSLLGALYARAMDGDSKAAQTLLAVRHGLTERLPQQAAQAGVQVVFNLPAAMTPDEYSKMIGAAKVQPVEVVHARD